jgi:dihydroorotase-like cyclic amidohydrolase
MRLHGGRVLRPGAAQVEPVDVLVDGDRIVEVGPGLARPPDGAEVDARGFLVLPGLINAHTLAARLGPYIAAACRAAVATPYPVNRYAAPVSGEPR